MIHKITVTLLPAQCLGYRTWGCTRRTASEGPRYTSRGTYIHVLGTLTHLGERDVPDVALRVDGAVVEGEAFAAPGVRQEDVALADRGRLAVLLQGDPAATAVAPAGRERGGSAGGRPLGLVAYRQPQVVVRPPVAVDSLHRQILLGELDKQFSVVIWLL